MLTDRTMAITVTPRPITLQRIMAVITTRIRIMAIDTGGWCVRRSRSTAARDFSDGTMAGTGDGTTAGAIIGERGEEAQEAILLSRCCINHISRKASPPRCGEEPWTAAHERLLKRIVFAGND